MIEAADLRRLLHAAGLPLKTMADYPHDEGTYPFSREHLRQVFHDWSEDDMRKILGENVARLYDFDLKALAPLGEQFGPTVDELHQPLVELPESPNEALLRVKRLRVEEASVERCVLQTPVTGACPTRRAPR